MRSPESVTMNGWSRTRVMSTPLRNPIATPIPRTIATAANGFIPAASPAGFRNIARITPRSASTEPTERSIPPVTMTNPMPSEKMP